MIVIILFIVIFLILNMVTLFNGHNWGEDFSQYIIHAQNILALRPYSEGIMLESIFVYPPGFPLMLAPIIKIVGLNFVVLKALNVVFWYLIIFVSLKFFSSRKDLGGWLVGLLLAVSSCFFVFKQNILSDIPFAFFIVLSLALLWRFEGNILSAKGLVILLCMCFTALLRSAGFALFISGIIYFLFIKKNYKNACILFLSLASIIIIEHWCIGTHPGQMKSFINHPGDFFNSIVSNAGTILRSTLYFLCPAQSPISTAIFNAVDKIIPYLTFVFYVVVLVGFIFKLYRRKVDLIDIFLFVYFGLMVFWAGYPHSPDAFYRFLLPLIIIVPFRMMNNLSGWRSKIFQLFLSIFIVINVLNIIHHFRFNDDVLLKEENQQMFHWVKEHLSPSDHYMSWPSRVLALMTSRVGTVPYWGEDNNILNRIERFQISYLILMKSIDFRLIGDLERNNTGFYKVWENVSYEVWTNKKLLK